MENTDVGCRISGVGKQTGDGKSGLWYPMPDARKLKWRFAKSSSQYVKVARMSIRMVAAELYRVMREIEALERKLENLEAGSGEAEQIANQLREARAQRDRLKKMIEGAKSP